MRKGLVGLRHTMRVFALLHRRAALLDRIEYLAGETQIHGLFTASAVGVDDPAHGQGGLTIGTHLHGRLIGGATDAARLHLDDRLDVVEGLIKRGEVVALALFADAVERSKD